MKKALSLILVVLMIISIVPLAMAETEYNYTIKTEFYGYDSTSGEWVPVTTASGGEKLKMRVSIETNFVSGPATVLLAYNKSALLADLPSNGSSTNLKINPDKSFFAYNNIQQVRGAHGVNAANQQLGYGNITAEQKNKYAFVVSIINTYGCVQYDGSDWLFEVDMNVLRGTKGESFDCFVIPGTVQTKSNKHGVTSFPYAPAVSTDLTTMMSAFSWYESTPVMEASQVSVIANTLTPEFYDAVFHANGGLFADGTEQKAVSVEAFTDIVAPETPVRQGYVFAGWSASEGGEVLGNLGSVGEQDKEFYAKWVTANDIAYTVETYTMNTDGTYALTTTAHQGTTGETVEAAVSESEGFELNEEKSVLNGVVAADGSLVLKVYFDRKVYSFTTVVDGTETTADYYYGASVTVPETPEKLGYIFKGWNGEIPVTMPAEDIVLIAQWEADIYTASFNANGGLFADGAERKTVDFSYDTEIISPETPVKEGYVFAGWSESEDGAVLDNLGKMDSTDGKAFYAQWIVANDVAYTVETYTIMPDGSYALTTTAHQGTTGETVEVAVNETEGFEFNAGKSVTEGVIVSDGSLVLKVYYDRKIYEFTTVVNGVYTTTEYRYGANVNAPEAPSVKGCIFKGWDGTVPATMPANNVTVTAKFVVAATVNIKNNPGSRTINFGETLRLTANTANMPDGAYVKWYVEGSGVSMSQNAENSTCEITSTGNGTVTVTAKVVDKNGNPLSNESGEISDSQKVTSKAGIWQKIVSFFKNLFGMNRTIIQIFKVL